MVMGGGLRAVTLSDDLSSCGRSVADVVMFSSVAS